MDGLPLVAVLTGGLNEQWGPGPELGGSGARARHGSLGQYPPPIAAKGSQRPGSVAHQRDNATGADALSAAPVASERAPAGGCSLQVNRRSSSKRR